MFFRNALILCSAALISVPVFSKDKSGGKAATHHWQMMDTNNDGSITRDEWNSAFAKHDQNNDGVLSRNEMMGGHGQVSQDHFRGVDINADGRISRDEWRGNTTTFSKLDKNSDGWLSSDEWNDPTNRREASKGRDKGHDKGHDKH